jgi:hypothetical protein
MQTITTGDPMGMFTNVVSRAQQHFPGITIKFKDESLLMKVIDKVVFFNGDFMNFTTTFGSTVYLPSAAKLKTSPVSFTIIFMHEVAHIYENSKNGILFKLLYLFPQVLALLAIPAFFLFHWYIALAFLLFLLPIPAYFRMREERRAYTMSLYVMNRLNNTSNFHIDLEKHRDVFIDNFLDSSYYYMWPFPGIKDHFNNSLGEIKAGGRPDSDSNLYEIIDNILE